MNVPLLIASISSSLIALLKRTDSSILPIKSNVPPVGCCPRTKSPVPDCPCVAGSTLSLSVIVVPSDCLYTLINVSPVESL